MGINAGDDRKKRTRRQPRDISSSSMDQSLSTHDLSSDEETKRKTAVEVLKGKPVERDAANYFRNKRLKMQQQARDINFAGGSKAPPIFKSVVIYVNGYTRPSCRELEGMIFAHGGTTEKWDSGKVTHVVSVVVLLTTRLIGCTGRVAQTEKNVAVVVHPRWVLDSVSK
eukprot:728901-Amorphochlora_amoeboformis.AAC.1